MKRKLFVYLGFLLFLGVAVAPSIHAINDSQIYPIITSNEPLYDTIDSPNIWISKPQAYRNTSHLRTYKIKSNNLEYKQEYSMHTSNGKTLYVGGSGPGNYSLIQFAINDASDGDTVFVFSGTYYVRRERISIDKSIHLIGENKETTIIDGVNFKPMIMEVDPIIWIFANGVTVSGFTIQNCGGIMPNSDIGIHLRSSHNNISGNIISNNNYGVLVGYPYTSINHNIISDNIFFKNGDYGLVVADSHNNIVSNNVFQNDNLVLARSNYNIVSNNSFIKDGVWVSSAYHNTFSNNLINDKPLAYLEDESNKDIDIDAGQIILVNCFNITVKNKDLSYTLYGIILEGTHNSHILSNTIQSAKLAGIYLQYSNNNNISMNILSDSKNGIISTYSYNNIIYSNAITSTRGFGVYLAYSEENTIFHNTYTDSNAGLILTGGANNNDVTDNVFINDGGVWVYGAWYNTFLNNSLNEKPIEYLEGQSDMLIDYEVGQVILVNCNNIEVENQDMSNTYAGIMIVESDNCKISNSTFTAHNQYGIFITHSNNNNISENIVTNSTTGIALEESENNILFLNTISSNTDVGIYVSYDSNGTMILKNNIRENGGSGTHLYSGSIILERSFDNEIRYNNFIGNSKGYCFLICSSNKWQGNYWDKPRIFPKLIFGYKDGILWIRWINIDWFPAQEPYEIGGIV
jgi:parallel beta-helix repeat protein